MGSLSWATFRERWTLFVGAAVTVCLGVALVQSALLTLISLAVLPVPAGLGVAERARFADGAETAIALSGITMGFATFLAVFIVGSTFAFTVAQRRADLALLRLVGAGRRQMRRLLMGEAVLLGVIGTAAGVPVGLAAMRFQSGLLATMGLVPAGFAAEWRGWILGVSAGVGIGVALAGVLVAARRAGRVRPLEALRDSGEAARVMTVARWGVGLLFTAGAAALVILAPIGGPAGGPPLASNAALCLAVALSALSPLLVPAVAALVPARGPVGGLAMAALRDGVRRAAATAAPVIVLVGLVLAQSSMLASGAAAGTAQQRAGTAGDLVVAATGPVGDRVARVPGVAWAATEVDVPITVTTVRGSGDDVDTDVDNGSALVIDPATYPLAHPGSDAVAGLHGRAAVSGPGAGAGSSGSAPRIRAGDTDLGALPVVGAVPVGVSGGPDLLLPPGLVPAAELATASSQTFVALAPGADRERVRAALAAVGEVRTVPDWIARDSAARDSSSSAVFVVLLGLGGLYALVGVINAVVVGAAPRPAEFGVTRLSGLTRGQVLRAALIESAAVTAIGLVLGGVAAGAAFAGTLGYTAAVTGTGTLVVPWQVVGALVAGLLLVTAVTTALTTWNGTRRPPIALLGART
jgi:putative ABC transport system permease protein